MKTKEDLLAELQEGLKTGTISEADIKPFIKTAPAVVAASTQPLEVDDKPDKLSAVDVMFYVAGIILFAAIMSVIVQTWNDGSAFLHIILSAGIGGGLWTIARYLIKSSIQTDVRRGLINSTLLTGSLCILVGGYIVTNELISGYDQINLIPGAVMLAVIGGIHIGFDRMIKKDMILLMGVLLSVAAFPTLVFGFLRDANPPVDVWSIIILAAAGVLAYATRVVAKIYPDRQNLHSSFDSFAAFVGLATMYFSTFSDYGLIWTVLLIGGIFVIFYLSIVTQNKHLLGNASFFLVLTVITLSFKYFSGFGVTTSLVLAAVGLLGSAAVASSINKKYFKHPDKAAEAIPVPQPTSVATSASATQTPTQVQVTQTEQPKSQLPTDQKQP